MDVIVSHVNADFDSLAGLVGARKLYPDAVMVLPGGESAAVGRFLSLHRDALAPLRPPDVDPETITRVIVVDTPTRRRIGPAAAWLDLPDVEVHLYDHHVDTEPDIAASQSRLEPWGSVSSILVAELRSRNETLTPIEATAMLLGIYEDTGSLSYAGTRPEDVEAAAWLLRQGAGLDVVAEFTRGSLDPAQRELLRDLLADARTHEVAGSSVLVATAKADAFVSEAAVLTHRLLEVEDAEAVVTIIEMRDKVYVIARSRADALNVGAALSDLGGGGHARAASATLNPAPLDEIAQRVIAALTLHAAPQPCARELMSHPVRSVRPDQTVAEARQRMVRYGHSGLLVLDEGRLLGILTRRDVDKARHHRLDHAPVRGFMTSHVHTATSETRLSELEETMITEGIGRLPVMRGDEVIGIVTRTDVLRALHGARYVARPAAPDEGAQRLRQNLPAPVQRLLEQVGELAARRNAQAYVVGGFVRDLLLGVRNLDVDILAEPDGIDLAEALAAESDGTLKTEPRFGTAKVTLPDGFDIDFASARTESYAHPGALPEVETSSISDDLRRRDFTINAMAIALRPEHFGALLDPFGGERDLERRRIRVLHNLSFVDDPTRLFRAVRFEERYQFRMEPHTEVLARAGVESGILGTITPERIRAEIRRILKDRKPLGGLLRLEELGVIAWLAPEAVPEQALLQRIPGALDWWHRHGQDVVDPLIVYLAALLMSLGPAGAARIAEVRLRMPPPDVRRLAQAIEAAGTVEELLPLDGLPADLTRTLRPLAPEALVLLRARAASTGEDREARGTLLERFITEWRHIKLEITGDLLISEGWKPGRALGEALARTLDARLDGTVKERDAELAYARGLLQHAKASGAYNEQPRRHGSRGSEQ
jgi:tRNA nucleotidyltransferase (CCA-adding enzyme)